MRNNTNQVRCASLHHTSHCMRIVMSKMIILLLITLLGSGTLWAQLENGKVYNFVNIANNGSSMVISGLNKVSIATTNTGDYNQLWYVSEISDAVYTLRNMGNGRYLRSPNATSSLWTMVNAIDDNCKFKCEEAGNGHTLRASNTTGGYNFMHYGAGQGAVVCWESSATATQWTITEVPVSDEDIESNWEEISAFSPSAETISSYQQVLELMFTDKACTQLNVQYSGMSDDAIAADENFAKLPAILQEMVMKVKRNDWTENNADTNKDEWNSEYAQRFRVQLYEPYNEPEAAAKALGINAHTNLNNPTGIYANSRQVFYIMVEGGIKDGASLYLGTWTGHGKPGGYQDGVELKEGLNIVPVFYDNSAICINYVVHTFDGSKKGMDARLRKLSDYAPLKIHIEGGHITGYYNKVGDDLWRKGDGRKGDNAADWDYCAARANQTDLTILGKYVTLQFPLNDADTDGNRGMDHYLTGKNNVEKIIDEWDNVMLWERMLMGLSSEEEYSAANEKYNSPYSDCNEVFAFTGKSAEYPCDYSDYYNVHGLSFAVGGNNYMYGGWDHCGYHYNTMSGVIESLPDNAGSHWGPGHEIGHQHQGPLNMRGLTEVTNNLFSNVVLWFYGETTSRYNGTNGALSSVLEAYNSEDGDFFSNNIWAQTHMYYKLFLYYHVLGHNTSFYPRLYEMLRRDPMVIGDEQDGGKCLLHFYKKCCEASGEDLTEFFRAHGFFKVMKNRFVGDYSNANYNMTQAQIDAAIAEVKEKKYPANVAVLFINDATGETIKSHKGDNLTLYGETTVCAEVGSYASFAEGTDAANYTFTTDGNTITVNGTGGVGFAIYNADGEIVSFSDKTTFSITEETAAQLVSGELVLKVQNANGTVSEVQDVVDADDVEVKRAALGELLQDAKAIIDMTDETKSKVGYYAEEVLTDLVNAYESAKEVYDNSKSTAYDAVYMVLLSEVLDVQTRRIGIREGAVYQLNNKAYADRSMAIDENNKIAGVATADTDAQRWYFVASDTKGAYYLKNKSTGTYAKSVSTSSQVDAGATTTADAAKYVLKDIGDGSWALVESTSLHCASSQSYKVVGWDWSNIPASHWYITCKEEDEFAASYSKLEELIDQTEELMGKVGEVTVSGNTKVELTKDSYYSNAECKETSYGDQFTSYSVLCDGNPETFFHSDYSSQAPDEDHYIRMDVGENNGLQKFNLNYSTRKSGNLCAPTKMLIEGSNDATTWDELADITSGLPTSNNAAHTISEVGNGKAYRYIRMKVYGSSTGQTSNGHIYFIVSELGLSRVDYSESLNAAYASMEPGLLLSVFNAYINAEGVMATAETKAELDEAYSSLSALYETLHTACDDIDKERLEIRKTDLKSMMDKTTALIKLCGNVNSEAALALQTTDASGAFYLSTNAPEDKEGHIKNLLDGDKQSFFHSAWSTDINEVHYLMVDMGDVGIVDDFTFAYQANRGPYPYVIKVSGAPDQTSTFTQFAEFSKDDVSNPLPTTANVEWISSVVEPQIPYRYLRFEVTSSGDSYFDATPKGEYCFVMSEFGITRLAIPEEYSAEVKSNVGGVTAEQLLAAFIEVQTAQCVYDYATEELQIDKAIAGLMSHYNAIMSVMHYQIPITSAKAATLYTPIALEIPEGVTAKYVKAGDNIGSTGTLWYTKLNGVIPANTAVVLIGERATYTFTVTKEAGEQVEGNVLFGYAENTPVTESEHTATGSDGTVYALANKENGVAFYHYVGANYLAGKAYLDVKELSPGTGVRLFNIFDEETETGIVETVNGNAQTGNEEIYDLTGRRVREARNGLYIVNGQRVIR